MKHLSRRRACLAGKGRSVSVPDVPRETFKKKTGGLFHVKHTGKFSPPLFHVKHFLSPKTYKMFHVKH